MSQFKEIQDLSISLEATLRIIMEETWSISEPSQERPTKNYFKTISTTYKVKKEPGNI